MARVTGPLFSLSASGTIGKAFTFGTWKGIAWCREWFVPANPQSDEQTNVRTALTLVVALWKDQADAVHDDWNDFASGTGMSGFNQFMSKAMKAYIADLGADTTPVSVGYSGSSSNPVWTWSDV